MNRVEAFEALCDGKRVGFGDSGHYLEISGDLIYARNSERELSNPNGHINLISRNEFYLVPKSGYEEIREIIRVGYNDNLITPSVRAKILSVCKKNMEKE